jgi:hypothetical protein
VRLVGIAGPCRSGVSRRHHWSVLMAYVYLQDQTSGTVVILSSGMRGKYHQLYLNPLLIHFSLFITVTMAGKAHTSLNGTSPPPTTPMPKLKTVVNKFPSLQETTRSLQQRAYDRILPQRLLRRRPRRHRKPLRRRLVSPLPFLQPVNTSSQQPSQTPSSTSPPRAATTFAPSA